MSETPMECYLDWLFTTDWEVTEDFQLSPVEALSAFDNYGEDQARACRNFIFACTMVHRASWSRWPTVNEWFCYYSAATVMYKGVLGTTSEIIELEEPNDETE